MWKFGATAFLIATFLAAPGGMAMSITPNPAGPAHHESMIGGFTWGEPVAHDNLPPVDCHGAAGVAASQCRFTYQVPTDLIDAGAKFLVVRVKAKAWVRSGEKNKQLNGGLIYASFANPAEEMNHFIHCEITGDGDGFQSEARRVTFQQVFAPIIDGAISFDIGKRVVGRGLVEIAFYYEGFIS